MRKLVALVVSGLMWTACAPSAPAVADLARPEVDTPAASATFRGGVPDPAPAQPDFEAKTPQEIAVRAAPGVTRAAPHPPFVHIAAGFRFTCAVASDHSLWCWGARVGEAPLADASPRQVTSTLDWDRVFAGDALACATKLDGSLWCWAATTTGTRTTSRRCS